MTSIESPNSKLVDDLLVRLDADEKLSPAVSELVLASLYGDDDIEACLGGQAPERPTSSEEALVEAVRAYLESIEVEGFRGIGARTKLALAAGPGLTLVVGRNGSGKSSFAEALELLLTGENQRWSSRRTKIWREGWRNLHKADGSSLEATLLIDGEAGAYVVRRDWKADADLDDGSASVTHDGNSTPLSELGWQDPLATYRPFLSYNELGSMLEEGPSKLFDALASILGLEELVAAADALKNARSRRSKAHKAVKDRLKTLRAELEAHTDERASRCLGLLKGTKWKLADVQDMVSGSAGATDDSDLGHLRELAQLTAPDTEAAAAAASELREALAAREALAGTDAEKARRFADILANALEIHEAHGDSDCPVCGRSSALNKAWHQDAEKEIEKLRKQAGEAESAIARLAEAERVARSLLKPAPPVLELTLETKLLHLEDVRTLWREWAKGTESPPSDVAHALESSTAELASKIADLSEQARAELQTREDLWRPLALSLASWLPEAEKMLAETDALKELKSAEDWVRTTATAIRNERFLPIKEQVRGIWELLRTRSHVGLEDVTFEGKTTSRRVNLDVTVDGTEGAALGVMSQGELHSLALALFLPRATVATSPFRFLVIDDPVQSMDPARVDGLARVLEGVAKDRQVIVFTHDDRLPEATRRLQIEATVIEVLRRERSVVELREVRGPVKQYLDDAFALASTKDLPKIVAERVIPGLCRQSLEAACFEAVRRRRLSRGEPHDEVEALLAAHPKLLPRLALALHDDSEKAGDVYKAVNNCFGPRSGDVIKECNVGAHKGARLSVDDALKFVRNVETVAKGIQALK